MGTENLFQTRTGLSVCNHMPLRTPSAYSKNSRAVTSNSTCMARKTRNKKQPWWRGRSGPETDSIGKMTSNHCEQEWKHQSGKFWNNFRRNTGEKFQELRVFYPTRERGRFPTVTEGKDHVKITPWAARRPAWQIFLRLRKPKWKQTLYKRSSI